MFQVLSFQWKKVKSESLLDGFQQFMLPQMRGGPLINAPLIQVGQVASYRPTAAVVDVGTEVIWLWS